MQRGTDNIKVKEMPAEITARTLSKRFSALYLVMSLETVIGVPELHTVSKSANTDNAT